MEEYDAERANADWRRFSRLRERVIKRVALNCFKIWLLIFIAQLVVMYLAKFMLSNLHEETVRAEKSALPKISVNATALLQRDIPG